MFNKAICWAAASVLAVPAAASASPSPCLDLTADTAIPTKTIVQGLPLTAAQKREIRQRVAGHDNLAGLELPADVLHEIQRRIDAHPQHPAGWPCQPFTNPARTLAWVRAKLVENGFRPNVSVRLLTTRQITIQGIQDGVRIAGRAARTGPREISVYLYAVSPRWSETYSFTVGFAA